MLICKGIFFTTKLYRLKSSWGYTPFGDDDFSSDRGAQRTLVRLSVLPTCGINSCLRIVRCRAGATCMSYNTSKSVRLTIVAVTAPYSCRHHIIDQHLRPWLYACAVLSWQINVFVLYVYTVYAKNHATC